MVGFENENKVNQMVMDRQAIPDVRFKLDIFKHKEEVNHTEKDLQRLWVLNNKQVPINYKVDFELALIMQFNDIKYMIIEKQMHIGRYEEMFKITEQLEFREREFTVQQLIRIKNYINECLHYLNLTNLIINNKHENPDEDTIYRDMMAQY